MAFKKNQTVTVEINDITDLGFGVGRVDGIVVFVSDTVPGDVCEVKLIKVNSTYLVGRAEKYITRSDKRVCTRCDERACKSCAYKNISYEYEANLKEEGVRRLFSTSALEGIVTAPVTISPAETRYRNKAQYPIALVDGKHRVGFFAPKSHRVTPIADCPLTPEIFSDVTDELLAFFDERGISVYDEETGKGLLRHIYLRRGEVSGELLVTVVVNGRDIPAEREMAKRICEKFPSVVGVLVNVNCENTNVVLGDEYRTLAGRDYIYDTLSGVRLKITAPSFYQVNHGSAELLYEKAKELARPEKTDTLLDLFCGAGSIGLSMADKIKQLVGVEIVPQAVENAKINAKKHGFENARFICADAKDAAKMLLEENFLPTAVVVDPPRKGCDEDTLNAIISMNVPKISMISCNHATAARDCKYLAEHGYKVEFVQPYDMFPRTKHVECVILLTK